MDEERKGFYFLASFRDSIKELPAKDQLAILWAVIDYGLDGTMPANLNAIQKAIFLLIKPILEKGRKKAANGKKGGSKPKANGKQNESKSEGASDLPSYNDSDSDKGVTLTGYGSGQGSDPSDLGSGQGMQEQDAPSSGNYDGDGGYAREREAIEKDLEEVGCVMGSTEAVFASEAALKQSATIAKELVRRYGQRAYGAVDAQMVFRHVTVPSSEDRAFVVEDRRKELLEYAFEQAALGANPGNWKYIVGILENLDERGIMTRAEAEADDRRRRAAKEHT